MVNRTPADLSHPASATTDTALCSRDRVAARSAGAQSLSGRLGLGTAARARRTALYLPANLPFKTWQHVGEQLFVIVDSSAWWLGDWMAYGQDRYELWYKKAVAVTSLSYQTLRNYAWVSRRFEPARRRARLSFQHHAEVAAMPTKDQDLWLERAESFGWSRNELRRRIRADAKDAGGSRDATNVTLHISVNPKRERRWEKAAEENNCSVEEWAAAALDRAASAELTEKGTRSQMTSGEMT